MNNEKENELEESNEGKGFFKKYGKATAEVVVVAALTGGLAFLGIKNNKLKLDLVSKGNVIKTQTRIIFDNEKRIKDMKELCTLKDMYFKETISDALRHGSSLGAKHMVDLKNLN